MSKLIQDDKLKMYILVRESIPIGTAVVNVAHASVACLRKFEHEKLMAEWISGPFYKVVCSVSDKDFEAAKKLEQHVVIREGNYGDEEIAIAFCPRWKWPRKFKYFRMYGAEPKVKMQEYNEQMRKRRSAFKQARHEFWHPDQKKDECPKCIELRAALRKLCVRVDDGQAWADDSDEFDQISRICGYREPRIQDDDKQEEH